MGPRVEPAGKDVQICLELKTWDMEGWKGAGTFAETHAIANPGEVVFEGLTPGLYDFAAPECFSLGGMGRTYFCDRQDVTLLPGESRVVRLVRTRGRRRRRSRRACPRISRRPSSPVRSAATGDPRTRTKWKLPTYDA